MSTEDELTCFEGAEGRADGVSGKVFDGVLAGELDGESGVVLMPGIEGAQVTVDELRN